MDALTPESELEAAIWRALDRHQATCGDALSFLDSILLAAKAYAASDSEELTALRRGVLRKAQTSPGTRGGASRAATELHPPGSVASDVSGVAGGGATTSTAVSIPGAVTSGAAGDIHRAGSSVHRNQVTLCDFCLAEHFRSSPARSYYACLKLPCQCWCGDRDDKPLEVGTDR